MIRATWFVDITYTYRSREGIIATFVVDALGREQAIEYGKEIFAQRQMPECEITSTKASLA